MSHPSVYGTRFRTVHVNAVAITHPAVPSALPRQTFAARADSHCYDYSSTYGNISNLNMSALPSGYIDATPVEATTLDGRKVSFTRRKKLQAYSSTAESKVHSAT